MGKNKLRLISIEGKEYLWKVETGYELIDESTREYKTHVHFTCYLHGHKNTPLIIKFVTWECPVGGNPLTSSSATNINLNKPSMARLLILGGIKEGWNGQHMRQVVENGKIILENAGINTKEI